MPSKKRRRSDHDQAPPVPRARPSEQLLIDALADVPPGTIVCTSPGRAQFAAAMARASRESQVACLFLDLYRANRARELYETGPANLRIVCEADLPGSELDAVVLPTEMRGEAELTRDLMQAGHVALKTGGRMLVSTDNPNDTWLHDEMRRLFDKVTRRPARRGVVYLGTKREPLAKLKNFEAEFAFRDEGRLIKAISRPGVFSHRRIDAGARALLTTMQVHAGDKVLDLGCGSGILSLAAAFRAENVRVHAVDSNPRAIACTEKGAALNGLTTVSTQLDDDAALSGPGDYDLVVANPPYFSDYRIAALFLESGRNALKPGGRIHVVTKTADWFLEYMPMMFADVTAEDVKTYKVITGTRRKKK